CPLVLSPSACRILQTPHVETFSRKGVCRAATGKNRVFDQWRDGSRCKRTSTPAWRVRFKRLTLVKAYLFLPLLKGRLPHQFLKVIDKMGLVTIAINSTESAEF